MTGLRWTATLVVLLVAGSVAANCGEGEEAGVDATASPTPSATASATLTSTPTSTATATSVVAPPAPDPEIRTDQSVIGNGMFELTLAPGEVYALDARGLAELAEVSITSCIDTSFYLGWQVRDPYPPTGVDFEIYRLLRGSRELYEEGESGQLTDGACSALELVNNSAVEITLEFRYAFAE